MRTELAKLGVGLATLAAFILIFKQRIDRTGVVTNIRLGAITNGTTTFEFTCPKAAAYHFVVSNPSLENWRAPGGVLNLQNKSRPEQAINFPFDAENLMPCNWLRSFQQAGIILNWSTNRVFESRLIAYDRYSLTLSFSNAAPTNASLWLCMGQSSGDKKEWDKRSAKK